MKCCALPKNGASGEVSALAKDEQTKVVPIVPCSDLDASQAFYEKLGFTLKSDWVHYGYRILVDSHGSGIHLTRTEAGWLDPERNAHGIYLYTSAVEEIAAGLGLVVETKPWGMKEFAVSDPDGTLVRIGWSE